MHDITKKKHDVYRNKTLNNNNTSYTIRKLTALSLMLIDRNSNRINHYFRIKDFPEVAYKMNKIIFKI